MIALGVDIGSTSSKCVMLRDGKIAAKSLVSAGTGTSGPARAIKAVLEEANASLTDMDYIMATGYGRKTLKEAMGEMSELSCHARGAGALFDGVRTVIDIGGQDAKVLRVNEAGMLESFVMNDKCAAGTGRFLDVMASILELNVNELERLDEESTEPVAISSTCTVFAESEVISQLAGGAARADVVRGIHRSVASRVAGLARRAGVEPAVAMTGGVARNSGVARALCTELGVSVAVSPLSQYAGALGAALFAQKRIELSRNMA